MDFRFAADRLQKIFEELNQYEAFRDNIAREVLYIGHELRKLHRPSGYAGITPDETKPLPPKSDPNSKIPIPVPPPRGSGPVKLVNSGVQPL